MSSTRLKHPGKVRPFLLIAALLVAGSGILAYRYVFHRAGEEAISLIPSDAAVVVTADLVPSPSQVALFERISKAMVEEHVEKPLESLASATTNGGRFLEELRPHLGMSYAFGAWQKPGAKSTDSGDFVGLAAIKTPSEVSAIAANHGSTEQKDGLTYYKIKGETLCAAVIRQYLVVSNDAAPLVRANRVANGEDPSVASLQEFKDARATLPAEANIMIFGNMDRASTAAKQIFNLAANTRPNPQGWAACGATLRDNGVEIVWRAPFNSSEPIAHLISTVKPIDSGLYNRLPSGALGMYVMSQPGAYYDARNADLGLTSDQKKSLQDGLDSFEQSTEMNIQHDLVTGLMGDVTLAVYPPHDSSSMIPNGLILLDDANGSDPASMVEKVKRAILDACRKNNSTPPVFSSETRDGVTIWTLDEATQKSLRDQVNGVKQPSAPAQPESGNIGIDIKSNNANVHIDQSAVHVAGSGATVDVSGNGVHVNAPGTNVDVSGNGVNINTNGAHIGVDSNGVHLGQPSTPQSAGAQEQQQITFAVIGKSVMIASSRSLLDRGIESYKTGANSLAKDPGYTGMLKQVSSGAQHVLFINAPDIMEMLRHVLTDTMTDSSGTKPDDIIKMFGPKGNGLVLSQGYSSNAISGALYIPIDYAKVIHILGSQKTVQKDPSIQ